MKPSDALIKYGTATGLKSVGFDWEVNSYYQLNYTEAYNSQNNQLYWGGITKHLISMPIVDNWNSHKVGGGGYFSAPSIHVAAEWLRNVHDIHVDVSFNDGWEYHLEDCSQNSIKPIRKPYSDVYSGFETFEEALEAGIDMATVVIAEREIDKENKR